MSKYKIGDQIQFKAQRIIKGNPVTGYVRSEDDEWVTIELTKKIEGLVNVWYAGEKKTFRKSFLSNIIVI